MIIRIIPRKKVFEEDDGLDTLYDHNVVSPKSEFCCEKLKDESEYCLKDEYGVFSFGPDYIFLNNTRCKYCPYCGTKIYTELIETELEERYQAMVAKEEAERLEYQKNHPPKPLSKYKVRKMKKEALASYHNVVKRKIPL